MTASPSPAVPALSALETVSAQVAAFNAHDLEAFVATYAEDAVVVGVAAEPIVGREALRAFYGDRLTHPDLRCEIDATTLFGDRWVVARESVVFFRGGPAPARTRQRPIVDLAVFHHHQHLG